MLSKLIGKKSYKLTFAAFAVRYYMYYDWKFGSQDFNKIKSKGLGNIREHYIGKVLFITLTEWLSKKETKGKWAGISLCNYNQ